MHRRLSAFLLFSLMLLGVAHAQSAAPQAGFDVKARQVYLIEAETGTVLFAVRRTSWCRLPRLPS